MGVAQEALESLVVIVQGGSLEAPALSPRERALLNYADRLTQQPALISADDIARLRNAGLDDRAIHDACAIVSYFAFVNRIADGLGVELEDPMASQPHETG
jgi:uncharacterized peroxidase-related enzyme